jgi:hypothetical protein
MTWQMYFSLSLVAAGDLHYSAIGVNCVGVGLHLRFSWRDMAESNESLLK